MLFFSPLYADDLHSKYYFTLFDAIYFTDNRDREDLERQIEERFESYSK